MTIEDLPTVAYHGLARPELAWSGHFWLVSELLRSVFVDAKDQHVKII